jgi:hypothetical protein
MAHHVVKTLVRHPIDDTIIIGKQECTHFVGHDDQEVSI